MPYYQYRCKICAHEFEHKKGMFDDDPCCPKCENGVERIFTKLPPVQFKGTGFYSTDDGLKRDKQGRIVEAVPGAE